MSPKLALVKAVELAGGQSELARKLTLEMGREKQPITQQNIHSWLFRRRAPIEGAYVIPIERIVGGAVTRFDLRPDLYPQEHSDAWKPGSASV